MSDDLNLDGLVEPPPLDVSGLVQSPKPTISHLPDLFGFLWARNLIPGSTTGGKHNAGSLHYTGNAIDIKGSGAFSDAQVAALKQDAASQGFLIRDERTRPPNQKVWGGPHVHIEYAGGQQQSDDGLNLDGLVEPLNVQGLAEPSVTPPVPMILKGGARGVFGQPQPKTLMSSTLKGGAGDIFNRTRLGTVKDSAQAAPNEIRPLTFTERVTNRVKEAINNYVPGVAALNTEEGIKTNAISGLVNSATLGIIDLPAYHSFTAPAPSESMQVQPYNEKLADTSGRIIGSLVPFIGAGKAIKFVSNAPKIARLIKAARETGTVGRAVVRATETGAQFGSVAAARSAVSVAKGQETVSEGAKNTAVDTLLGSTIGILAGDNPTLARHIMAFAAPPTAMAVATGKSQSQVEITGNPIADTAIFNSILGLATYQGKGVTPEVPQITRPIGVMPEIPDVPVSTIAEPRVVKKGAQVNATQEGVIPENNQQQYQGTQSVEVPAETGGGNRPIQSGEVQQEALNLQGLVEPFSVTPQPDLSTQAQPAIPDTANVTPQGAASVASKPASSQGFVEGGPLAKLGGKEMNFPDGTKLQVIASPDDPSVGFVTGLEGKDIAGKADQIKTALANEGFKDIEYRPDNEDARAPARQRLFESIKKRFARDSTDLPTVPPVGAASEVAPMPERTVEQRFPKGSQVEYAKPGETSQTGGEVAGQGEVVGYRRDPTTGDTFVEVKLPSGRSEFVGDTNNIRSVSVQPAPPVPEGKGKLNLRGLTEPAESPSAALTPEVPQLSDERGFLNLGTDRIKSWLNRIGDVTLSNLRELRDRSPAAYEKALALADSAQTAKASIASAIPKIEQAYGQPFENFSKHLIESNLRGARQRFEDLADQVRAAPPADFYQGYQRGIQPVLDEIAGVKGVPQDIREQVETALSIGDVASAKMLADRALQQAARTVHSMDYTGTSFESETSTPQFQNALSIYKADLEQPLADAHAANKGVFIDTKGPLDAFYPLSVVDPNGDIAYRGGGRVGSDLNIADPFNPNNNFRTGRADDYSADIEPFVSKFVGAVKRGDRAAFIDALRDANIAVPYHGGEPLPDHVAIRSGARIYGQQGVFEEQAQVPRDIYREIKTLLEKPDALKADVPGVRRLLNSVISYSLKGLLEPAIHGANISRNLATRTPFIFKDVLTGMVNPQSEGLRIVLKIVDVVPNIILNTPYIKSFTGYVSLAQAYKGGDAQWRADVQTLGKANALPSRFLSETYRPNVSRVTGADIKSKLNFGPRIFGESGWDIRSRVVALRILRQVKVNPTSVEVNDFVNSLGIYNRAQEGAIVRAAKEWQIGTFATAGSTRIMNGVRAWVDPAGLQNLPKGTPPSYRVAQVLSGSAYGTLAIWALTYKAYRGMYPWQDPKAKLLQVPLNSDDRNSSAGQAVYGPGNDTAYVGLDFGNQVGSGARALGLAAFFDTKQEKGTTGQAMERGAAQSVSTIMQPLVSNPLLRAGIVSAFGVQPRITSFRDSITGRPTVQFAPAVNPKKPGLPQIRENIMEGVLSINGFLHNVAGNTGIGYEPKYTQKLPASTRFLQTLLNMAAPGIIRGTRAPYQEKKRLLKEQRIERKFK